MRYQPKEHKRRFTMEFCRKTNGMLDREEEKEKIKEKLRLSRAEGGEGLDQS